MNQETRREAKEFIILSDWLCFTWDAHAQVAEEPEYMSHVAGHMFERIYIMLVSKNKRKCYMLE